MSESQDPPRWSEGGQAPSELRRLLSAARGDGATPSELAQLGSKLGSVLGATPVAPLRSIKPLLLKASVGLLVVAGSITTALLVRQHDAPIPAGALASASAGTQVKQAPESPPLLAAPQGLPVPSPQVGQGSAGAPAASAVVPAPHRKGAVSSTSHGSLALDEASLLEQARSKLASNPGEALALTEKHRAQFPRGMLAQEREVIAIGALRRLGRVQEAKARATRFDQQYPRSAHQQSVDGRAVP